MEGENKGLLITMSDDKIFELTSATHDDRDQVDNTTIDLDTIFSDTDKIVGHSFFTLCTVFNPESPNLDAIVSTSLWTFVKTIGLEMSCEDGGAEIITLESRMLQVLKKLSKYSWEAKVVLAVASFALEYVKSDLLNKSVGILKQSIHSTNPNKDANLQPEFPTHPVVEAIHLIKRTLELKRDIFLPHGASAPRSKANPFVNEMSDIKIPVQVYWIISITIACATQIKLVTCQEQKKAHDLSQFSEKLRDAERMFSRWRQESSTIFTEKRSLKCTPASLKCTPAQAMDVFRDKIFPKDSTAQTVLIDGSTNQPVDMDVLRWRHLLLLFSGLDISEESDLSPLKIIYEGTKLKDSHKIVWIPMVKSWKEDRQRQYEKLRSKMPWYIVQCSSPLATGMSYIKKELKFKGKPILVVMDKYGAVENYNALPLIRKKGMDAFPFQALHNENQSLLARMSPFQWLVRSNK